ncbi:hypothetical protein ACTXT7_000968 [Hymenolepis weldensis]
MSKLQITVVVVAVPLDGAVVMDAVAVATAWVAVDAVVDTLVAMVDAVEALVVVVAAVAVVAVVAQAAVVDAVSRLVADHVSTIVVESAAADVAVRFSRTSTAIGTKRLWNLSNKCYTG